MVKVQRRLRHGATEPVLNSNGALVGVQRKKRCNMAEASLHLDGGSVANTKNGDFSMCLIIRRLQNTLESRICNRRNSWWIWLKSRGWLIALFVNYFHNQARVYIR